MQTLPDELERMLRNDPGCSREFELLSPDEKDELIAWINGAPDAQNRQQRIDIVISSLR